jgi:hypothetical protein
MRKTHRSIVIGIAVAMLGANLGHAEPQPLPQGVQDVIQLTQAGIGSDIILHQIKSDGIHYDLTVDQLIALKNLGVQESVITALMQPAPNPAAIAIQGSAQPEPAVPNVSEVPQSPSLASFQAQLTPFGTWVDVPGYGSCWEPTVESAKPDWRPYFDCGHWAYTDAGWNWQSDYPWGSIAFHYGRWTRFAGNWAWVPGYDWAPAWVTWRESDGYCGWAPLPPGAEYRPGVGLWFGAALGLDVDFGVGADCFSFVSYDRFWDRDLAASRTGPERREDIYRHSHIANGYRVDRDRFIIEGPGRDRIARFSHHDVVVESPRIEIGLPSVGIGVGFGIRGAGAHAEVSAPAVVVATPRVVISSPAVEVRPRAEVMVSLPRVEFVAPKVIVEQPHVVVAVKTPSGQAQVKVSATTTDHKHDH